VLAKLAQLVALTMSAVAFAQDHQPARIDSDSTQSVELVKTGLLVVSRAQGNTVVRLSGNGIILVDGALPGHYGELVAKIRRIADELPIRMLITTSQDETHAGTNADFLSRGIPVVAQEKAQEHSRGGSSTQAKVAPPSVTFGQERTIKLGGVTVQLFYFGPAHTDADAVVYFPDLKVVAVGDLYTRAAPYVDPDNGGSLAGWAAVLQGVLQLDFDRVIPGSGAVVGRAELQTFKSRIDALIARELPPAMAKYQPAGGCCAR